MRKSGGRGRGRGLPASTDGGGGTASGGSGKSTVAPKAGGVEPASSSGYTRPRRLPYLGVGKQLLKPEQQEKVLSFLADSASSSFASSSQSSKSKSSQSSVDASGPEKDVSLCPSPKPKVKDASGDTTGYSMELFTHTVPGLEREIVHCPLQEESDMECTDAQPQLDYDAVPLTQITTLTSQFPEPESDPDETMVPCPERYSTGLHGDTEEGAHDIVEEEVIDDPVLDPDWQPLGEEGAAGTSSQAEEGYLQQHQSTSQQLSSARPVSGPKRVTKKVLRQRGQPLKVAQRAMPEKEFHSRKSEVWHFFDPDPNDQSKVICKKCSKTFSRGKILQNLNTTCMRRHLTSMHLQAWTNYQTSCTVGAPGQNEGSQQHYIASLTVSPPVRTPPAANVEGSSQGQSRQGIRRLLVGSTVCRPTSPTVSQSAMSTTTTTASSTICRSPVQLTLEETLVRKRKYSSSHPRTQGLNAHIARLISLEMMPYRLVESKAFKDLMAYAVPCYDLHSRHFFARKAIPALHQHVKDRIVHALRQSVSGKVHLTTDAWTSRNGQGRYVSITAHWVNVVDAGSTGDSHSGTVLPSPQSRKQLAF
ncbi:uncharacterized protein LOC143796439 [Ranitomeya variabilis]|uniref:uncharacterized protein LOC143796439 n=1 Tax=Ranitomeya variabilis TaxID=490064 RepID=UPI004055DAB4